MRLDPGGGRGPNGGNNGIGRIVFNLALAGGLTYLTVTGKLGWLFDAFISLWVSFSSIYAMAITNTFAATSEVWAFEGFCQKVFYDVGCM
jgi:hypothetical protein